MKNFFMVLFIGLSGCSFVEKDNIEEVKLQAGADYLLQEASEAMAQGNLKQAEWKLERALRLNPRHGEIYFFLATLRMQQNSPEDAVEFASKGLRFASNNLDLQYRLWVISAVALQRLGDEEKSSQARIRAQRARQQSP